MDFQPQMKYTLPTGIPIPFFLAYPAYLSSFPEETDRMRKLGRDFEYLRRTYPARVRRYQRRVEEILDRMDYEGSMIYDEYPDRIGLWDLSRTVLRTLENEGEQEMGESEKEMLQGLIQVLVCDEICRRRHGCGRQN